MARSGRSFPIKPHIALTPIVAPTVSPNAESTTGSGTALLPTASVAPNAGLASGIGLAFNATVTIQPLAGVSSVGVTANQPTVNVGGVVRRPMIIGPRGDLREIEPPDTIDPLVLSSGSGDPVFAFFLS